MIHLTKITHIMAQQLLHDVLGDAGVDEPGSGGYLYRKWQSAW